MIFRRVASPAAAPNMTLNEAHAARVEVLPHVEKRTDKPRDGIVMI